MALTVGTLQGRRHALCQQVLQGRSFWQRLPRVPVRSVTNRLYCANETNRTACTSKGRHHGVWFSPLFVWSFGRTHKGGVPDLWMT